MLFISPVVPSLSGNGLAMRAATMLRALAPLHDISLHVVPLYSSPASDVPEAIRSLCRTVEIGTPGAPRVSRQRVRRGRKYDVVHVFRLATMPYADLLADAESTIWHLDLDDVESRSQSRIAALACAQGHIQLAEMEEAQAIRIAASERIVLARVDRVYVCSEIDRADVAARTAARVVVVPNAVEVPPLQRMAADASTLLFVGTLGYYPNTDAVEWFCRDILPMVRRETAIPIDVQIVGSGDPRGLESVSSLPGVHLIGQVPDVAPYYRRSLLALNPVRAGGGTRIKALEAFAQGCALVSTSVGMEGIEAKPGEHLLVGDDPTAFASCCVRLMGDADLRARLRREAHALVSRAYAPDAVARIVEAIDRPAPHRAR